MIRNCMNIMTYYLKIVKNMIKNNDLASQNSYLYLKIMTAFENNEEMYQYIDTVSQNSQNIYQNNDLYLKRMTVFKNIQELNQHNHLVSQTSEKPRVFTHFMFGWCECQT